MISTYYSLTVLALTLVSCNASTAVEPAVESIAREQQVFTYHADHLFPGDGTLNRAEDGVSLPDGRIVVVDQVSGLRLLEEDGSGRPFGDFAEAGYVHSPPEVLAGPNGVVLDPDGDHVLVSDVFDGKLYRVNIESEEVEMFYDHSYGVNTLYRDKSGAVWFTQSTDNSNMPELFSDINLPSPTGAVYRLENLNSEPVKLVDSLYFANGITMDAEEQHLFVAETMMDRIQVFKVDIANGVILDQEVAAYIPGPDNITMDNSGRLIAALPIFNQVVAIDFEEKNLQVLFDGSTPESSVITREWMERSHLGIGRLELFTPELSNKLPGAITGMFFSADNTKLYISNLGNDLLQYDLN